jgi:hypothetical protein
VVVATAGAGVAVAGSAAAVNGVTTAANGLAILTKALSGGDGPEKAAAGKAAAGVRETPPGSAAKGGEGHLVRFGSGPETAEGLAADAARAEANGFPQGVSTRLKPRISGSDKAHRSAPMAEVQESFPVTQTGKDPRHHTVELPKPVTPEVAEKFNSVFKPKE